MTTVDRTKESVDEFERDSVSTPPFDLGELPREEREYATMIDAGARAVLLKALLHRHSPAEYPVSRSADSLEAEAVRLVQSLDAAHFARMAPKIAAIAGNRREIDRILGAAAPHVDLRKPSVDQQLTKMSPRFPTRPHRPIVKEQADAKAKFNRLELIVRKLHCGDETNPEGGADDMILGGMLFGPGGHAKAVQAFVAGEFDDGDVQNYGALPWGSVSLNTTSGYPKNCYCIFLLTESDSDDKEVASAVSKACTLVAAFAIAVGGGVVAAAFTAAAGIIDLLIGVLVDEDEFPPYGTRVRLTSENQFGSDGVDVNRRTEFIKAHGGSYRVAYRWELTA